MRGAGEHQPGEWDASPPRYERPALPRKRTRTNKGEPMTTETEMALTTTTAYRVESVTRNRDTDMVEMTARMCFWTEDPSDAAVDTPPGEGSAVWVDPSRPTTLHVTDPDGAIQPGSFIVVTETVTVLDPPEHVSD